MLFLLLSAEFLAAAQVVVYAGAVMVLYVFVVAYIGGSDEPLRPEGGALALFGPLFAARRRPWSCASRSSAPASRRSTRAAPTWARASAPRRRSAQLLLTRFLIPFEAASFLLLIAAVGAVVLARRRRGPRRSARLERPHAGGRLVDIAWYLVLSAFIFCIGAAGVLTRRNPLVVLLCLELMLNAGNLALVAFSRMHGGQAGQVFALIVMVIAACEVVIGLGIIVAMYRNRLPIDIDEMSELRG